MSARRPAAWLHTLHMEGGQTQERLTFTRTNPFDAHSPEYLVVSEPLDFIGSAAARAKTRREARAFVRASFPWLER